MLSEIISPVNVNFGKHNSIDFFKSFKGNCSPLVFASTLVFIASVIAIFSASSNSIPLTSIATLVYSKESNNF